MNMLEISMTLLEEIVYTGVDAAQHLSHTTDGVTRVTQSAVWLKCCAVSIAAQSMQDLYRPACCVLMCSTHCDSVCNDYRQYRNNQITLAAPLTQTSWAGLLKCSVSGAASPVGHGHSTFRRAMATNGFGHSTVLHYTYCISPDRVYVGILNNLFRNYFNFQSSVVVALYLYLIGSPRPQTSTRAFPVPGHNTFHGVPPSLLGVVLNVRLQRPLRLVAEMSLQYEEVCIAD